MIGNVATRNIACCSKKIVVMLVNGGDDNGTYTPAIPTTFIKPLDQVYLLVIYTFSNIFFMTYFIIN